MKKLDNIYSNLDIFFDKIKYINSLSYALLRKQNYMPLFNLIGISDKKLINEIVETEKLTNIDDKEAAAENLLLKYPNHKYVLFYKASLAVLLGQNKKAITLYNYLLSQLQSPNAGIYFNLGNLYAKIENYTKAKKYLRQAISLNPQYDSAYINLGVIDFELHKFDEAIKNYRKAIQINSQALEAHYNLATVFRRLKQYAEAKRYFLSSLEINPNYANSLINFANLLCEMHEYETAKKYYKKALKIDSKNANVYYNFGNLLYTLKKYDQAIKQFSQALTLNPFYAEAHYNLGYLLFHYKTGFDEEANKHLQIALYINPDLIKDKM